MFFLLNNSMFNLSAFFMTDFRIRKIGSSFLSHYLSESEINIVEWIILEKFTSTEACAEIEENDWQ